MSNRKKESVKILDLIEVLKRDNDKVRESKMTKEEMEEKNKFMIENYPTLARKVMEDKLDMGVMKSMLRSLDKMQDGEQSQHEASVEVGTFLRDKFVIPDLKRKGLNVDLKNNISGLSEEEAKKKINSMLNL